MLRDLLIHILAFKGCPISVTFILMLLHKTDIKLMLPFIFTATTPSPHLLIIYVKDFCAGRIGKSKKVAYSTFQEIFLSSTVAHLLNNNIHVFIHHKLSPILSNVLSIFLQQFQCECFPLYLH